MAARLGNILYWLGCSLAVLMFITSASAGQLEDADAAYNREDYATALRLLRPLAERGDVRAQSLLGVLYQDDRASVKDLAEAAKWLHKAADQGIAAAQNALARL